MCKDVGFFGELVELRPDTLALHPDMDLFMANGVSAMSFIWDLGMVEPVKSGLEKP